MSKKTKNIIGWVAAILSGGMTVMAGFGKVSGDPKMVEMFEGYGFPSFFVFLIGGLEILGGIGLLIPKTRALAAISLIGLFVGIVINHILADEINQLMMPLALMVLFFAVFMIRKGELPRFNA